jgi:inner membrane protein import complex subunit Tim44-like protein
VDLLSRSQRGGAPQVAPEVVARLLHGRVADSFAPILRAWSNRDLGLLRPYVSEEYLERAAKSMDELDENYQMHRTEDDDLLDVAVERPFEDEPTDVAAAYLWFVSRYWSVDLRTGKVIAGDPDSVRACTVRWTFVFERRHGWVADRLESIWAGPDLRPSEQEWPALPAGWYARARTPDEWMYWDGATWFRESGEIQPPYK